MRWKFYEFFAGGGMARAGLGSEWDCLFANDIDPVKVCSYRDNWGSDCLVKADIAQVSPQALTGQADLAWASFPCQDLSLAGNMQGMAEGTRSGVFWAFWRLMVSLAMEGRQPPLIAIENVVGFLRARESQDFANACALIAREGYRLGAAVIDAAQFVPQSRPRVFLVAAHQSIDVPKELLLPGYNPFWHPASLLAAYKALPPDVSERWLWWRVPLPIASNLRLRDLLEPDAHAVWHSEEATSRLLSLMSEGNLEKVEAAGKSGEREVGAVYRRIRPNALGEKAQRAEVRFDGVAGCLRTPTGGSSRQTILVVEGRNIRSRLLTAREAARLMGLPNDYKLPPRYNEAYHLAGDGVVVPVVRHLAERLLEPLLTHAPRLEDPPVLKSSQNTMAASLEIQEVS